jgi:hypothetical protein
MMSRLNRWVTTIGVSTGLGISGVFAVGIGAAAGAPAKTVAITVPPSVIGPANRCAGIGLDGVLWAKQPLPVCALG